MIGTIDIRCNAHHPNLAIQPLYTFVASPSNVRVADVPKKIGDWKITEVFVQAIYPDNTVQNIKSVLVGGVWVATIPACSRNGTVQNGFTIVANGIDENGNEVNGYVLGKGDIYVLENDEVVKPDSKSYVMRLLESEPDEPKQGDVFKFDDTWKVYNDDKWDELSKATIEWSDISAAVSANISSDIERIGSLENDVAGLSNSLSDYYVKNETSSDVELDAEFQTKADISSVPTKTSELSNDSDFITSAQVKPSESTDAYRGYAENSVQSITLIGRTVSGETFATIKPNTTQLAVQHNIYSPWLLTMYNGTTFDPPLELTFGYQSTVTKLIGFRQITFNVFSYCWYHDIYFIKAEKEEADQYYKPTTFGLIDTTTRKLNWYKTTYDNNVVSKSIVTIDGQSDIISCTRLVDYPIMYIKNVAYEDDISAALSAKADLSAVEAKQDRLSEEQLQAISSVIDERQTVVEYADGTVQTYNIVGAIDTDSIDNKVNAKSIVIADCVKSINDEAFDSCSGLTSITIPDSVTYIGDWAFYDCSGLTSIVIPDSVTYIGGGAFRSCSGLTSIVIPDSVTYIGSGAFYDCSGLTSIVIPASVTDIGNEAFRGCSNLSSVTFKGKILSEVQAMSNYPWGLSNTSIIQAFDYKNVLDRLAALESQLSAMSAT